MATRELRKQVSIHVPLSEFKVIQAEAARLKIPMSELIRRWMKDGFEGASERYHGIEKSG